MALLGQLPDRVVARLTADPVLRPHLQSYHRPLESLLDDALLEGVGIYIDDQKLRPVRSMLALGKSFQ